MKSETKTTKILSEKVGSFSYKNLPPIDGPAVFDHHLWAGQLSARITMYRSGFDTFEVYASVGGSVPTRFVGNLGACNTWSDVWLQARKHEGFEERAPDYQPPPIN